MRLSGSRDLHERWIRIWHSRHCFEVSLGMGLHMWQRPAGTHEVQLAARRTVTRNRGEGRATVLTVLRLPLSEVMRAPTAPLAEQMPCELRRLRALLADIGRLRLARAQGRPLDPQQLAKIQREGSLRQALAARTWAAKWRTAPAERLVGEWHCPQPLCQAEGGAHGN